MKGGLGLPEHNECIKTKVQTAGDSKEMVGRFVNAEKNIPAGLLVGNTIYEVIDPTDYESVDADCGPMYDQRKLYRDQRYNLRLVAGKKSRKSRSKRAKKTLKKKQVSKRK